MSIDTAAQDNIKAEYNFAERVSSQISKCCNNNHITHLKGDHI